MGVMLEHVGMVTNEKKLYRFNARRACRCATVLTTNGRAAAACRSLAFRHLRSFGKFRILAVNNDCYSENPA
jgi:hypothetical protein